MQRLQIKLTGGVAMESFTLRLSPETAAFYREVAKRAGITAEQAAADALFKLAGELSLQALARAAGRSEP